MSRRNIDQYRTELDYMRTARKERLEPLLELKRATKDLKSRIKMTESKNQETLHDMMQQGKEKRQYDKLIKIISSILNLPSELANLESEMLKADYEIKEAEESLHKHQAELTIKQRDQSVATTATATFSRMFGAHDVRDQLTEEIARLIQEVEIEKDKIKQLKDRLSRLELQRVFLQEQAERNLQKLQENELIGLSLNANEDLSDEKILRRVYRDIESKSDACEQNILAYDAKLHVNLERGRDFEQSLQAVEGDYLTMREAHRRQSNSEDKRRKELKAFIQQATTAGAEDSQSAMLFGSKSKRPTKSQQAHPSKEHTSKRKP